MAKERTLESPTDAVSEDKTDRPTSIKFTPRERAAIVVSLDLIPSAKDMSKYVKGCVILEMELRGARPLGVTRYGWIDIHAERLMLIRKHGLDRLSPAPHPGDGDSSGPNADNAEPEHSTRTAAKAEEMRKAAEGRKPQGRKRG